MTGNLLRLTARSGGGELVKNACMGGGGDLVQQKHRMGRRKHKGGTAVSQNTNIPKEPH